MIAYFSLYIRLLALFLLTSGILVQVSAQAAQPDHVPAHAKRAGPASPAPAKSAPRHILLKLDAKTKMKAFSGHAGKQGLRHNSRVYGSDWHIFSLPAQASPHAAAALARSLPGVVAASTDPIVSLDVLPPRDPIYIEDDDPS